MDISADIIALIFKLVPGFFTAWIWYGLTAYRIGSPFERVIQALVFTAIIETLTILIVNLLAIMNLAHVIHSDEVRLGISLGFAIALGVTIAWLSNTNGLHQFLWKHHITNGSSYPSNWYKAFVRNSTYIVLHLKGNRRLYGYPLEWPDHPDDGHFVISQPEWLIDNDRVSLTNVEQIVISSTEVEMIEMMKKNQEISDVQS